MKLPGVGPLVIGIALVLAVGLLSCRPVTGLVESSGESYCESSAANFIKNDQGHDNPVVEITNIREVSRTDGTIKCTGVARLAGGEIKPHATWSSNLRSMPIPVIWVLAAWLWLAESIGVKFAIVVGGAAIVAIGWTILDLLWRIVRRLVFPKSN